MAGHITRRELLKRGALASAALTVPFIHCRYAHAGEIDPASVKKFGASLKGHLILPGDKEYESARRLWRVRNHYRATIGELSRALTSMIGGPL